MTEPINLTSKASQLLKNSQNIVILLPPSLNADNAGAALALQQTLSLASKSANIASDGETTHLTLPSLDKIRKSIVTSGDVLSISFPYTEGAVEKVSYSIDDTGSRFNLLISPHASYPRLQSENIVYDFVGGKPDLIIALDLPNLQSLGEFYTKNQKTIDGVPLINIDRHFNNTEFGTVNIINKQAASICELVFDLLVVFTQTLDPIAATCLYHGILASTKNFAAYNVTADTLEMSAKLLRFGAQKPAPLASISQNNSSNSLSNPFANFSRNTNMPDMRSFGGQDLPSANNFPPTNDFGGPQSGFEDFESFGDFGDDQSIDDFLPTIPNLSNSTQQFDPVLPNASPIPDISDEEETPDDWLKPKIFRPPSAPSPSGQTS